MHPLIYFIRLISLIIAFIGVIYLIQFFENNQTHQNPLWSLLTQPKVPPSLKNEELPPPIREILEAEEVKKKNTIKEEIIPNSEENSK